MTERVALDHEQRIEIVGEAPGGRGVAVGGTPGQCETIDCVRSVIRRRVRVTGRVQGVWFRASTQALAAELGLAGWVRNCPDGSVEAVFEGPEEAVGKALMWCRTGPPRARVDTVHPIEEPPDGREGFEVR